MPFDVFRTDGSGRPMWLETCSSIDDSMERVRELGALQPGEYVILNERTSRKIFVNVEGRQTSELV
jgi:hypothetical protein